MIFISLGGHPVSVLTQFEEPAPAYHVELFRGVNKGGIIRHLLLLALLLDLLQWEDPSVVDLPDLTHTLTRERHVRQDSADDPEQREQILFTRCWGRKCHDSCYTIQSLRSPLLLYRVMMVASRMYILCVEHNPFPSKRKGAHEDAT